MRVADPNLKPFNFCFYLCTVTRVLRTFAEPKCRGGLLSGNRSKSRRNKSDHGDCKSSKIYIN